MSASFVTPASIRTEESRSTACGASGRRQTASVSQRRIASDGQVVGTSSYDKDSSSGSRKNIPPKGVVNVSPSVDGVVSAAPTSTRRTAARVAGEHEKSDVT